MDIASFVIIVTNSILMSCARQNTALKVLALKDTQRFANTSAPIADLVKCSFKHVTSMKQNDTAELESKINNLEECIQIMSQENDSHKPSHC